MMKKKLRFLDRYLTVWIFLSMALGLVAGNLFPSLPEHLDDLSNGNTNIPLAIGLICMMYPPLAKVNFRLLPNIFQDVKLLRTSVILNWIVGPIIMFLLAWAFLPDLPNYRNGVILIGLARCIAMVLVWNDLAGGNKEYAAALVAINSLFQIFIYGFYAMLFLYTIPEFLNLPSQSIQLPFSLVAESVLTYLGIPFALGAIGRWALTKFKSNEWYENIYIPFVSPLTLIALLATIFFMFSLKGELMTKLPTDVLRIALPLSIYFGIMFIAGMWMSRKASYDKRLSIAFTATGNNFELAIAVSIAIFGLHSGEAFAGVVGPLIEVPALIVLVNLSSSRIFNQSKGMVN